MACPPAMSLLNVPGVRLMSALAPESVTDFLIVAISAAVTVLSTVTTTLPVLASVYQAVPAMSAVPTAELATASSAFVTVSGAAWATAVGAASATAGTRPEVAAMRRARLEIEPRGAKRLKVTGSSVFGGCPFRWVGGPGVRLSATGVLVVALPTARPESLTPLGLVTRSPSGPWRRTDRELRNAYGFPPNVGVRSPNGGDLRIAAKGEAGGGRRLLSTRIAFTHAAARPAHGHPGAPPARAGPLGTPSVQGLYQCFARAPQLAGIGPSGGNRPGRGPGSDRGGALATPLRCVLRDGAGVPAGHRFRPRRRGRRRRGWPDGTRAASRSR